MKLKTIALSAIFALLGITAYMNPHSRRFISEFGNSSQRTVLASIETHKLRGPHPFKILKIKEGQDLWLEVYFVFKGAGDLASENEFHKRLNLKGSFDGHMLLQEQATNLAIANIDSDQDLEILAPTYDRSMNPILNIYKYDPILEEFNLMDSPSNRIF